MGDYKADRWINGERPLAGRVALIRKNVSLSNARKADYPTLLMVSLVYHDIREDGLPGARNELVRLDNTEEMIADHFCARYGAQFALCVTSNGTRDLFLFLPRRPSEQEIATDIESCSPSVDYDFGLRNDPEWRPFMAFLPGPDEKSSAGETKSRLPWWKKLFGSS
jgi:hypothetical protein